MITNKIRTILVLCLAAFQVGCYKDESTVDTRVISEIEIEFAGISADEVNIDKNETLTITPVVTQTGDKPLTYEWEVGYEIVSTEKDFTYVGNDLGSFPVRLKVSNEDGSAFLGFTLNVNSPYERGLLILGEDAAGKGTISFLRKYPERPIYDATVADFATNVFALNNPGMEIGQGPSDVAKRGSQLYFAALEGKITQVNDKTFEVESVITAPEFADFKPYRINIPDNTSVSSIVLTESGRVYTIATRDHLILGNTALPADVRVALKTQMVPDPNFTMNYYWDPVASRLWNLWYTTTNSKDELAGQELIHFFAANNFTYVLTRDKTNPSSLRKTVFGPYIQEYFADPLDIRDVQTFTNASLTLKDNSVTVLNERYLRLIYANGRDIFRWNYGGVEFPSAPYIQLDIPGQITSMATDPDGTELYVGVYDASASGMKGSVVMYDIESGTKLGTFQGVADKPIELFFKQ